MTRERAARMLCAWRQARMVRRVAPHTYFIGVPGVDALMMIEKD